MKAFKITQEELDSLLRHWDKASRVFVPTTGKRPAAQRDCVPGWRRIAVDETLVVAHGPSPAPVKPFLFPQPETMLVYTMQGSDSDRGLMREPPPTRGRQVVVGLRPCDARSVFLNNLPFREDALFQANLQRTVLVGFTCQQPLSTCFCGEMGGSPLGSEGLDIALTETVGGFVVEVLTAKGEELVADQCLTEASAESLRDLSARRQKEGGEAAGLAGLLGKSLDSLYEASLWQALGEACLNCGICTFRCPTCYCFDIQDEVVRGRGRRIRYWDSCMFPLYSLHTSGHNPRGHKLQRTRNRFLHKLKYFPQRYGPFSCVGCGRCVKDCPVNIDIREVMADLLAVE